MPTKGNNQQSSNTGQLQHHRDMFLESLKSEGYAPGTVYLYELTINCFCQEVQFRGLSCKTLGARTLNQLRNAVLRKRPKGVRPSAKCCLAKFISFLTDCEVIDVLEKKVPRQSRLERLRSEYEVYLKEHRGLTDASVNTRLPYLDRFMTFRFGKKFGDLNKIKPNDIIAFLQQFSDRSQSPPSHIRTLFKFLYWSGKTKSNLANSIPRVSRAQRPQLPRHLQPEEVERLLKAIHSNDALGRRNYAMLLVVSRLGLRGTEVIAIQLDDINWRTGEILIRGKGELHDRMPLPPDVGTSIVDYLQNGRKGKSRVLFVSHQAPHGPFPNAQIVNSILKNAFAKTGIKPPQRHIGAHVLRHSLAIDMLRNGAALDEIRDVLRHRSRLTTTIYAKHDIEGLRSIAQTWPTSGGEG